MEKEKLNIPTLKAELRGITIERVVYAIIALFSIAGYYYGFVYKAQEEKTKREATDLRVKAIEEREAGREIKREEEKRNLSDWQKNDEAWKARVEENLKWLNSKK